MVDEPNPSPQDLRDGPTDKHPGSILIAAANAVERSLEKLPVSVRVKIPPDYRFFNAIVDALRPFITKPAVVKDGRVDFPLSDMIRWRRALGGKDGRRPHYVTLMNARAICSEIDEILGPLPAYGTDPIMDWHPKNDPPPSTELLSPVPGDRPTSTEVLMDIRPDVKHMITALAANSFVIPEGSNGFNILRAAINLGNSVLARIDAAVK